MICWAPINCSWKTPFPVVIQLVSSILTKSRKIKISPHMFKWWSTCTHHAWEASVDWMQHVNPGLWHCSWLSVYQNSVPVLQDALQLYQCHEADLKLVSEIKASISFHETNSYVKDIKIQLSYLQQEKLHFYTLVKTFVCLKNDKLLSWQISVIQNVTLRFCLYSADTSETAANHYTMKRLVPYFKECENYCIYLENNKTILKTPSSIKECMLLPLKLPIHFHGVVLN